MHWFKSSYCAERGACVEVTHTPAAPWHTASYSAEQGACVEVTEGPVTGIRDTQNRELGALFFEASEWRSFLSPTQHSTR